MSSRDNLGWSFCEVKQKVESLRKWCMLENTPGHRIIRHNHDWSLAKGIYLGKSLDVGLILDVRDHENKIYKVSCRYNHSSQHIYRHTHSNFNGRLQ